MTPDYADNLWRSSHQKEAQYPPLDQDTAVDLLVIGGGFTGCSAALEGARTGATVAVVDAATIGHGGSGRNAGLVNAGLWLPSDEIIEKLGPSAGTSLIEALGKAPDEVFALIERESIDCAATRNGTLHLAHAPSGLQDLESRFRQGNRYGAPLQLLDAEQARTRTGSDAFHGALFDPRAGTIQPLAYCRGLAEGAVRAGAKLHMRSKVSELSHQGQGGAWRARVNGHVVTAKHVLVATNAYMSGCKGIAASEFVAVRFSQFATAPLSAADRARILPGGEGAWDTALIMTSLRMDAEGRLVIGGMGDVSGAGSAIHQAWARRKLASYYPDLAHMDFQHCWQGKIAMTSDHIPKILRIGPNGLSVFGYSGRGIGPGTVFGQRAARALLLGETDNLPIPIRDRYQEKFRTLRAAYCELGTILTHVFR